MNAPMTTAEKHADRTRRRLDRRGPDGLIVLTYASGRTARKARAAMNDRHPDVCTAIDEQRRRVAYAWVPIDAEGNEL